MKGQEAAPIELLIGVTILALAMVIGFMVWRNIESMHAQEIVRANLNRIADAVEYVYRGVSGTSTQVRVDFSKAGALGVVKGIGIYKGEREICRQQAGVDNCYFISLIGEVEENGEKMYYVMERRGIAIGGGVKLKINECDEQDMDNIDWNWYKEMFGQLSPEEYKCFVFFQRFYVLKISKEGNDVVIEEVGQ